MSRAAGWLLALWLLCVPARAADESAMGASLRAAGWSAEVAARIAHRVATARGRVVAVFDHDGTLMHGDVTMGSGAQPGVLRELIDRHALRPAGARQIAAWMQPDPWQAYVDWTRRDPMRAYGWLPTVLAGFRVSEFAQVARDRYRDTYQRYLFPEMLALLSVLRDAGVQVFIVSASAQPLLDAAGPFLGVPADHIFGIRLKERAGVILPEIEPPPTYAAGKVWKIEHAIRPQWSQVLAFGDSYVSDGPMLRRAMRSGGVGVLINPPASVVPRADRDGLLHQSFASERRF